MYYDEDLIPGYKCRVCGNGTCKDEAFSRKQLTCICLDCSTKEEDKEKQNI